jgi:hypothetical protein
MKTGDQYTINCSDCGALIWRVHSYRGKCADCEVRTLRREVQELKERKESPSPDCLFCNAGGAS